MNDTTEQPTQFHDALEKNVYGEQSVKLRNTGGILAVITVCLTALINSYTIYLSVNDKGIWPSETSMFIMMVGPVIAAWSWMAVNKTLQTLLSGESGFTKIRAKLADAIAPSPPKAPPVAPDNSNNNG